LLAPRFVWQRVGMNDDLIYDFGMHNGDDTAYYLSRGFRVVAIEANPTFVEQARSRFAAEIESKQLSLVGCAIAGRMGTVTFWVNDLKDEWSALDRAIAGRDGTPCHPVEVAAVTMEHLLENYGMPWYLKSDMERGDLYVLQGLRKGRVPKYLSIEGQSFDYLPMLWELGYRRFKLVDQMRHNLPRLPLSNESRLGRAVRTADHYLTGARRLALRRFGRGEGEFPPGSSGPLSEETPGEWLSFRDVAYEYLHKELRQTHRGHLNMRSWHDIHARLD
jgi:FkbM family methyltransferase